MKPARVYRRQAKHLWSQVERLRIDVRRRSRQNHQLHEMNRCLEQELRCRVALINSLKRVLLEATNEATTESQRMPLQTARKSTALGADVIRSYESPQEESDDDVIIIEDDDHKEGTSLNLVAAETLPPPSQDA